jgi:tetratricopeptide (TPR) repeat protein
MAQSIIQFNTLAVTALIATFFPGSQVLAVETYSAKASLLANIAVQYTAIGKSEQAAQILDQALPLTKANTNECFKANPILKVAGGYILVGQEAKGKKLLAEAIQIARTQTATGCSRSATSPDESLLNRAREYAEAGYYDLALEIITGVNNPVFTPIAMAEVVGHYAKAGEDEQATKVLNEAIKLVQRLDQVEYRTLTLIGIAEHLSQAGQTKQVPQVLERALESGSAIDEAKSQENGAIKAYQMLRIAKQFAKVGQEGRAIEVLDQSLPKIRTLADKRFPLDKVIQLTDTAIEYAALGQKNKAIATLAEARTAAQAINDDALVRVAQGYAEIGDFEQAQQIARSIKNVNGRESAFSRIAIAYAKAGNSDQAVKLAQSIGNSNGTFIGIVRHYIKIGQNDQALDIVQKWNVLGIMSELVLGYLNAGQPDRALEIVQKWNLKDMQSGVVSGYVEAGQPERAMQLAKSQDMEWTSPRIARGFAKQGKFEQALQVAQSITNKSSRAETLTAIAQQYVARERDNKGPLGNILSVLANRVNSRFDSSNSSNKDKASEILDQALQIAQSMTPERSPQ